MRIRKTEFPVLYKYTTKGQIQQWQIIAEGGSFYTIEGIKDGKLTTSKPTICTGKNIGKKNEVSQWDQAVKEAEAKFKKKTEGGYALKVEDSGKKFFAPMLAESYKDKKDDTILPWVKELMEDTSVRKFVQPKLDGIRCINQRNELTSREGKPFVTCPHLYQSGWILDGELYNHKFKDDFNAIVSMIKQPKASVEDLEHAKKYAEMWIYDLPSHKGTFSERLEKLVYFFNNLNTNWSLKLVPTYEIFNEKDLVKYHKDFIKMGYEGIMVRIDNAEYEHKRSKQLIKYKDWVDEEFIIVDAVEGEGGRVGTIGKFILQHDVNPDQTFSCNVKGNFKYLTEVWNNRDMYIGKEATVQYKNRTPIKKDGKGNVPRHGYVIKIDRKSYE